MKDDLCGATHVERTRVEVRLEVARSQAGLMASFYVVWIPGWVSVRKQLVRGAAHSALFRDCGSLGGTLTGSGGRALMVVPHPWFLPHSASCSEALSAASAAPHSLSYKLSSPWPVNSETMG